MLGQILSQLHNSTLHYFVSFTAAHCNDSTASGFPCISSALMGNASDYLKIEHPLILLFSRII